MGYKMGSFMYFWAKNTVFSKARFGILKLF
jgi:hypothetical protein